MEGQGAWLGDGPAALSLSHGLLRRLLLRRLLFCRLLLLRRLLCRRPHPAILLTPAVPTAHGASAPGWWKGGHVDGTWCPRQRRWRSHYGHWHRHQPPGR